MFRSVAITLTLGFATATAQAALLGRAALTPGGTDYQAYYDDVLDLTWLADANYAQTMSYDPDGRMTWEDSLGWINSLNVAGHLGVTGWRLPDVDINADGTAVWCSEVTEAECRDNEYYYIYEHYGIDPTDSGPFENIGDWFYWANEEYAPSPILARGFNFSSLCGGSCADYKTNANYAWAVRDGDIGIGAVPVPPAAWLFGSALGLMGVMRRKA
jgi:hypothetical protein